MNNFISKILILILLQTSSSLLLASETGYEVELIIFEDATDRYFNSEDWSYNDNINHKDKGVNKVDDVDTATKIDPEFLELDWENAKLSSNLERLKNNSNFRILAIKRWKQTGLDREHAFNISIEKAINTKEEDSSIKTSENEMDLLTADNTSETNLPQQTESYLTGNVKLIMSRYLHFNVDMKYVKPQQNEVGEVSNIIIPIINERRMRSREIHYIDHPLVGIVVLATPYKIKTEEDDTDTSVYKTM